MHVRNAEVARLFAEMAQLLEIKGENVFRVRAYERAAQTLEGLSEDVAAIAARNGLASLPGIGRGLAAHIAEYLASGRIAELDTLRAEVPRGLLEVLAVRGVGPRTARLLWDHLRIDSVERLEQAATSGEILTVPGIRAKTRDNILAGLRTLRAGQERLPLGLALARAEELVAALRAGGRVSAIEVAGSARRRRETVGDLDILVTSDAPKTIIERFVGLPGVESVLARGDTKASVQCRVDARAALLQVDLRVVEPAAYGAALQYFTGSKDHNVRVRELGQKRGLKVSEYGVFDERTGAQVAGATEAEVYEAVGLPWIPPELRENAGEIEAALARRLPALVTVDDIRGDLHAHTDWSDGQPPIEDLVAGAEARGYEYIIVSDHSRSSTVAGGLTPAELREQVGRIRALQPRHRIRILAGTECDILADGRMDFPDDLLAELDVVLAAVHSRFKQPRAEMTARIVRAIENPHVDILVHPTGRLIGERDPYDVDLDAVFAAARARDKAVEINASWQRLDLKDTHARRAAELGVRIAISTDAHDLPQLGGLALGVATARRAWITAAQVVNALPLRTLLAWTRSHAP